MCIYIYIYIISILFWLFGCDLIYILFQFMLKKDIKKDDLIVRRMIL